MGLPHRDKAIAVPCGRAHRGGCKGRDLGTTGRHPAQCERCGFPPHRVAGCTSAHVWHGVASGTRTRRPACLTPHPARPTTLGRVIRALAPRRGARARLWLRRSDSFSLLAGRARPAVSADRRMVAPQRPHGRPLRVRGRRVLERVRPVVPRGQSDDRYLGIVRIGRRRVFCGRVRTAARGRAPRGARPRPRAGDGARWGRRRGARRRSRRPRPDSPPRHPR